MTLVGALGARGRARVDARGRVDVVGEGWSFDWWVGADDRWRIPAREPGVRQRTLDGAPVLETAMRVPGGDALQRVYGVGGPGGIIVVEIENASPAAFVAAFTIHGARAVGGSGARIEVDGRPALIVPSAPARFTVGTDPLRVETIGAETGVLPAVRDRRARIEAAFLYPLSHRNRIRVALAASGDDSGPVELAHTADAVDAASGWAAVLEHGMRVVLPDARLGVAVDLARTQVLLDPDPDAATTAALEDWGHDAEAAWAWRGLSLSARRAARRRRDLVDETTPAGILAAVHRVLLREPSDRTATLDLAPALPAGWWGQDLEVHDAPTRSGRVSYAVRWHGPRPALLWEVTDPAPGLRLQSSTLDPTWWTRAPVGETLLNAPEVANQ